MKTNIFKISFMVFVLGWMVSCQPAQKQDATVAQTVTVTTEEVNQALQAWCNALVQIGQVYEDGGDYKAFAAEVIETAYNYGKGEVFFKPTLTYGPRTFRPTAEGAHAYFVGGNEAFPEDKGFALAPWTAARYTNQGDGKTGIQIHGDVAIFMGNVFVTGKDGNEVMVDKTFAFKKGEDGKLKIILHHSSLPYNPSL